MFAPIAARGRHHRPGRDVRLAGSLIPVTLILAVLTAGLALADPGPAATRLSAADAARAGLAIRLARHAVRGETLIEVLPGAASVGPAAASRLLAASPDGTVAALADRLGEPSGTLVVAHGDGSQLRLDLPGLLAAAFTADGSRLAVIDGRGALWQVDVQRGDAEMLAAGPFLGTPIVASDGSILLLSVSSVEAPYRSRLVRLDPSSGVTVELATDELVYAAFPLADGAVAFAAHQPGRTVVQRIPRGSVTTELVADLGRGAVNVTVSGDGRTIAYEAGSAVFLVTGAGAAPRRLGPGSEPCLAPDGGALLVRRGARAVLLALDGSILAVLEGPARFAGAAGCPS
ncbi:MAG TPA: hypothetical protein VI733_00035 [Candidatus Limnocylindria bacterium]|nr:hypothetical protein [Candidatus Limnocylindria bacterium]